MTPFKLKDEKEDGYSEFYWIAHPNRSPNNKLEQKLVKNRYQLEIYGGVSDPEAHYSYDDVALVRLDNDYYLLRTSGCSCPSPSETWWIEKGPSTLDEIKKHVVNNVDGFGVMYNANEDIINLIERTQSSDNS